MQSSVFLAFRRWNWGAVRLCAGAVSTNGCKMSNGMDTEVLSFHHRQKLTPLTHVKGNDMRRRRYRKPKIKNVKGYWIAQYRDLGGTKRKVSLGPVKTTKKSDAEERLATILEPTNSRRDEPSPNMKFGPFVRQVYLPYYSRKWKRSTAATNVDRLQHHLLDKFEERPLGSFSRGRDELQDFLDGKAKSGLSYSVVAHLRWDLRQVFRMAVSEQYMERNPAELLFVPSEAPRAETRRMNLDDVRQFFAVLDLRERVDRKSFVYANR